MDHKCINHYLVAQKRKILSLWTVHPTTNKQWSKSSDPNETKSLSTPGLQNTATTLKIRMD